MSLLSSRAARTWFQVSCRSRKGLEDTCRASAGESTDQAVRSQLPYLRIIKGETECHSMKDIQSFKKGQFWKFQGITNPFIWRTLSVPSSWVFCNNFSHRLDALGSTLSQICNPIGYSRIIAFIRLSRNIPVHLDRSGLPIGQGNFRLCKHRINRIANLFSN